MGHGMRHLANLFEIFQMGPTVWKAEDRHDVRVFCNYGFHAFWQLWADRLQLLLPRTTWIAHSLHPASEKQNSKPCREGPDRLVTKNLTAQITKGADGERTSVGLWYNLTRSIRVRNGYTVEFFHSSFGAQVTMSGEKWGTASFVQ